MTRLHIRVVFQPLRAGLRVSGLLGLLVVELVKLLRGLNQTLRFGQTLIGHVDARISVVECGIGPPVGDSGLGHDLLGVGVVRQHCRKGQQNSDHRCG